jgi:RecJ-like exonuclease
MADSNGDDQQSGRRRVKCPDCGGSGQVVLLTTRHPCQRCAGSGQVPAQASPAPQPGARRPVLTLEPPDEQEYGWNIIWDDGDHEAVIIEVF